jgi:hypothetical protein
VASFPKALLDMKPRSELTKVRFGQEATRAVFGFTFPDESLFSKSIFQSV